MTAFPRILALSFLFLSPLAGATVIKGMVISVEDGDTITVITPSQPKQHVRLAHVDAPEISHKDQPGQPFGTRSHLSLASMCFGRQVTIDIQSTDQYGRSVGEVWCGSGSDAVNVNREQVARGYAWVYRRYNRDPSYLKLEENARQQRLGLWADSGPVAPWEFRAAGKKKFAAGSLY